MVNVRYNREDPTRRFRALQKILVALQTAPYAPYTHLVRTSIDCRRTVGRPSVVDHLLLYF